MAQKVSITYVQPNGERQTLQGEVGTTVMEVAKLNLVDGIEAECGGACACATCHVYVDAQHTARVGQPNSTEEGMLDFAFHIKPESRLACQIKVTAELDGLVVHVPPSQFG